MSYITQMTPATIITRVKDMRGTLRGADTQNFSTSLSMVGNTFFCIPVSITGYLQASTFGMRVIGGGSAGSVFKVALYRAGDRLLPNERASPNQFVTELIPPISAVGNNTDRIFTHATQKNISPGLYWIAIHNNSTSNVTFRGLALAGNGFPMPSTGVALPGGVGSHITTGASGTFPYTVGRPAQAPICPTKVANAIAPVLFIKHT